MTRLTRSHKKQTASDLTVLTIGLIGFGFILFYFGSQAFTPEDAHLLHWGLAGAGGAGGWLVGWMIDRFRR